MTETSHVIVTLPADVQMIDETGYVWTFLHEASEPDYVRVVESAWSQPDSGCHRGDVIAQMFDLPRVYSSTNVDPERPHPVLAVDRDPVDALRGGRRQDEGHRSAFGDAHHVGPLGPDGIHHGDEIACALLDAALAQRTVREAGAPLVEVDDSEVLPEASSPGDGQVDRAHAEAVEAAPMPRRSLSGR